MVATVIGWIDVSSCKNKQHCMETIISIGKSLERVETVKPENSRCDSLFFVQDYNHMSQAVWYLDWLEAAVKLSADIRACVQFEDTDPMGKDELGYGYVTSEDMPFLICSLERGRLEWQENPYDFIC